MKFTHTLLLLIFSFTCAAQVDVHFPNAGDAATQEWVKLYLDQWLSRLPTKNSEQQPVDPDPAAPVCITPPNIVSISGVNNTSIRVTMALPSSTPITPATPVNPAPASFTSWQIAGWSGEVWKPAGYTSAKTYSVIYIHDGVTLYAKNGHSDGNWNLDQRLQSMITANSMREAIIVSINTPDRMRTLLPNKPFFAMSGADQAAIAFNNGGTPRADETLNFMVTQLKPYIDANYSTKKDRLNTVIAGASMGGIFAAYAYAERNDIFGKMAALSPHYQGTLVSVNDNLFTDEMVNYISTYFPNASAGGMIYFDRGTTSLDENYATPQNSVNVALAGKGYTDANFKKVVFIGGGHTNTEWGEHVPGVFSFLLPPADAVVVPPANDVTSINWYVYKTSAPGLYLKQGNVPFSQTINLAWTGDLPAGKYGLKIQAVNCTGSATKEFLIENEPATIPCGSAPKIENISVKTKTQMTFTWSGLNVPEVIWNIKQGSATVRTGSFVPSSNTVVSISYLSIPPGDYQFQLVGLTCASQNPSVAFNIANDTPPVTSTGGRHVYMNFTGYGFNPADATGLAPEWRERAEAFLNLTYQGNKFKGIDGIRINVKWFEYEPSEGNFRDDKMLAAINWCIARGIKLSIDLVPWRKEGDNVIPDGHKATLANDNVWYEIPTSTNRVYMPSMSSDIGRTKFKNCARHLSQFLKAYPNTVDYISTTTGHTEEYYLAKNESPVIITGYASADKDAWIVYSNNQSVPYPAGTGSEAVEQMIQTPKGRLWYEFQTNALRGFHAAFVQGVKEGGGAKACGMYSATGAPFDAWHFTNKLNTIFSAGTADQPDLIYSSAGDPNYNIDKLQAIDLNLGTFPGADAAIEFDPADISSPQQNNPPYDVNLDGNILYDYSASFFRRGGKTVHIAMAFDPSKVSQLTEALWKIKTQFLDSSSGMTGIEQGTPFNYPVTNYVGLQPYRYLWQAAGGSLNKQVKFNLQ